MIGIVYLKSNNQVIGIVEDVQTITTTDIVGINSSVKGIDKTLADYVIVDNTELDISDIIDVSTIADTRANIHKTKEEQLQEQLDTLALEILTLRGV